jgi:hypothetical protein
MVMPEGENWLPFGGLEGKEDFQDTFVNKPREIYDSIMTGAQAEADRATAAADWYKKRQGEQAQENAVLQQRRQERIAEEQAQMAKMEQATQRYADDLADRGQWWRQPGNIIAAFGAALMTLGSDDHAIGYKLINQQIQQDYSQRKALADTHLGQLQSNIAHFRQIAGDAALGDQLAQAENSRVAAMELERIGQQFQGPIAKAKAAAIAKNFLMDSQRIKAQVYAQMVYNKAHAENPAIARTVIGTGKATGGAGYTPFGGQPGQGPGGAPVAQGGRGGGIPSAAPAVAATKQVATRGELSDQKIHDLDRRYPGLSDRLRTARTQTIQERLAESGLNPQLFQDGMTDNQLEQAIGSIYGQKGVVEYNKKMVQFRKDASEDNKVLSAAILPNAAKLGAMRSLGSDMDIIEQTAKALHTDPDTLLGTRTDQIFGPSTIKALDEFWNAGGDAGKHAQQKKRLSDAISRFKQLKAGAINQYFRATSGSAVSKPEEDRLNLVIKNDARWASIRNFQTMGARDSQNELTTAKGAAKTAYSRALWDTVIGTESLPVSRVGIEAPGGASNPQGPGNTGKTGANQKGRDPIKGTARDPDVQRAAASALFSKTQKAAIKRGE